MNKSESKYFNTAVRMDEAFLELLEKKDFDYITIKEICDKAGVNRSTFYLHYETIADLTAECIEYVNEKCFKRYRESLCGMESKVSSAKLEDLIFITPEYLKPYLEFVKENKRLFATVLSHPTVMDAETTFANLFKRIFSPIMSRFHYADDEKQYVIAFYVAGLISIVSQWLKNNCADSIDAIIRICMKCIMPNGKDAHLEQLDGKSNES